MTKAPINRISRGDIDLIAVECEHPQNALNLYQTIAITSAIYPGKGTPFGLMYAALGLAEAGEVQNKVKKAFRDDEMLDYQSARADGSAGTVIFSKLSDERRAQIVKELGGVLWYVAAVCDEIGASMSEVALQNLEELCSRGERGTLQGSGDDR